MVFALLQEYEQQYALERVAEAGCMDLFRIIKPFITSGKHCAFAAFKSAVRIGHGPLMHGLIGFISEGDLIEAFQLACESAYAPSNLIQSLIQEIPIGLRTQACTDAFESAITRGKVELLSVLITGGANVNKHFNNEMWESDERTCLHWLGMWDYRIVRSTTLSYRWSTLSALPAPTSTQSIMRSVLLCIFLP
jgi:hypothetical protein